MIPIAVFSSGSGSNFEAIADAVKSGALSAEIVALVCDRADAPVIGKAKARGIQTLISAQEEDILRFLAPLRPRFAVLAGYMRVLSATFLQAFAADQGYYRVTNIHPSILPAFPGLDGYGQAFNYGARVAGCTVHLVDQGIDTGPICAQETFSTTDCGSVEEVRARGLALEHRLYPESLRWILKEQFMIKKQKERICVLQS